MSVAVDRLLAALEAHGCGPRRNGTGWSSRCPAHDDERPSLSISVGDDGRALAFCHVCGRDGTPQVVEAVGLTMPDLRADNGAGAITLRKGQARRIVARYPYCDERGELLFEVVRYDPKDFRQRRPDGDGWIWKLGQVRRVLYNLPELVKAPAEAIVYVSEGEKDVDRLASVGLLATTCAGGAEKWKHVDDSPLEGRRVVVIPDADGKGRKHAEDVARRLHGRAASVKVLDLFPDRDDGGDVSDWLDAGGDPEDLDRLAAESPLWEPGPPPELEPYRNGRESMVAVRKMCKTVEGLKEHAKTLAGEVAIWFDRKGDQHLTMADGEDVGFPLSYVAACLHISRQHLYLLRDIGRVRRLLPVSSVDDTSDRALRPLVKVLKDRPEQIPGIVEKAWEIAGDRPITGRHVRQAIGQDHAGEKIPRASTPSEIVRRLAACLDAVTATPDVPLDILRPLRTARDNARQWAKGGDR